jgi:hypothetical protein
VPTLQAHLYLSYQKLLLYTHSVAPPSCPDIVSLPSAIFFPYRQID